MRRHGFSRELCFHGMAASWHDRVRGSRLLPVYLGWKGFETSFWKENCFITITGGSPGLQWVSLEPGVHLICFSIPLSVNSSSLLQGTIKLLLAVETQIAADFPWSLSKPSLAWPMSYAHGDLWVPWKQSKPETFLQNLLTFFLQLHISVVAWPSWISHCYLYWLHRTFLVLQLTLITDHENIWFMFAAWE